MRFFWHQGPQDDTKSTEWAQPRQPQKYEATLLGRQRTGSRLTCLRRRNKASQLKRHQGKPTWKAWKAYRKTNQETQEYESNNTKIILGPRASFCRNKAHKDKEPRVTHLKKDRKHLRHKERRRDGNKANQLKMRIFWHQGPQEDTKSTEWTQPRQTLLKRMESTWENWHGNPKSMKPRFWADNALDQG